MVVVYVLTLQACVIAMAAPVQPNYQGQPVQGYAIAQAQQQGVWTE